MLGLRDIVIFGCGGFGREILQIVLDQNAASPTWRVRGFLVSPDLQVADSVQGFPVYNDVRQIGSPEALEFAVGVGNPEARLKVVGNLRSESVASFPVLVHPRAWIGAHVKLEDGVVVCAGALLTTDIKVREHSHINIGATVGHDSVIGSFSTLSPGVHVSGRVTLGDLVEIGTGACINPGLTIGSRAVIGSAAAVVRDIAEGCTAVGVPARVIKDPNRAGA